MERGETDTVGLTSRVSRERDRADPGGPAMLTSGQHVPYGNGECARCTDTREIYSSGSAINAGSPANTAGE